MSERDILLTPGEMRELIAASQRLTLQFIEVGEAIRNMGRVVNDLATQFPAVREALRGE